MTESRFPIFVRPTLLPPTYLSGKLCYEESLRIFIVFEHGLGAADYYGTTPVMIAEVMNAFGLRISLMDSWLRGKTSLTKEAFAKQFYNGTNFYFVAHP